MTSTTEPNPTPNAEGHDDPVDTSVMMGASGDDSPPQGNDGVNDEAGTATHAGGGGISEVDSADDDDDDDHHFYVDDDDGRPNEDFHDEDEDDVVVDDVDDIDGDDFVPPPPPQQQEEGEVVGTTTKDGMADDDDDNVGKDAGTATSTEKGSVTFVVPPPSSPAPAVRKSLHKPSKIPKGGSLRLTENLGPNQIDWKLFTVATVLCMMVASVIVGTIVGIHNHNKMNNDSESNDESSSTSSNSVAPVNVATTAPTMDSSVPVENVTDNLLDCNVTIHDFDVVDALTLYMTVTSSITSLEVGYAAAVFQTTYEQMVQNGFSLFLDADYCDPYCRQLDTVMVTGYDFIGVGGNTTDTAANNNNTISDVSKRAGCDQEVAVTFAITGTYVGCPETPFPGLFAVANPSSSSTSTSTMSGSTVNTRYMSIRRRTRHNRQLWEEVVTKTMEELLLSTGTVSSSSSIQHNLRGMTAGVATATYGTSPDLVEHSSHNHRSLQDESGSGGTACPVCPDDSSSLGDVVPTPDDFVQIMDPFVTVVPAICELIKVVPAP